MKDFLIPLVLAIAGALLILEYTRRFERWADRGGPPLEVDPLAAGPRVPAWLCFSCGCEREAVVPLSVLMTEVSDERCPAHHRPVVAVERSEG